MTTPPDPPTDALPLLCALEQHAQEMPPENTCSDDHAPSRWLAHVKYAFSFGGPLYGAFTIVEFRPPGFFNSDLINTIFPEAVARGQELLVRVIEDFLMRKSLERLTFLGREDVLTGPWIELPINKLYGLWVRIDWAGGTIYVQGEVLYGVRVSTGLAPNASTVADEKRCEAWLVGLMAEGDRGRGKAEYAKEANNRFNVGRRAFDRAWRNAVTKTGNTAWSAPGRKS